MSWFKVDDAWWRSRKVMPLSLAARGLWATAGAWCAENLTDGLIEESVLTQIAPGGKPALTKLARELVDAGMWVPAPKGWTFHDWAEYQPPASVVLKKRAEWRARQAKSRAGKSGTADVVPIADAQSRRESR